MSAPPTLVVLLHVQPGKRREYERYEAEATRIMGRHGGRIERRIAISPDEDGSDRPDELHVVTFPTDDDLQAYLDDPDAAALGDLRARAIRHTDVWRGTDLPAFDQDPRRST